MRRAELVARVNQPIRGDYKIDLGTRQGGKQRLTACGPGGGSGRQLPVVDENTDYPAHHPTHPSPPTPSLIRGGGGPGLPKAPGFTS